jgi:hypothetical protein
MPHTSEIESLCRQMQPCAQALVLDIVRKYQLRWPLPPPSGVALPPASLNPRLDHVNNVINGRFLSSVSKVVDGQ